MIKKEWLEVGKQSLSFILLNAGMVLFNFLQNLLQDKPFEGDMATIGLGLMLLVFSMIIGISPFAQDSKQKGMEYLLTLPYSRRRLLLIKLLPRLAAVVLFYLVFIFLYSHMGNDAFGGYFAFFSLSYFALFFIAFSFSIIHENLIVQFILAGLAFCGYLTLCSFILTLGFAWNNNFSLGSVWRFGHFGNIIYDSSSLIAALAVFLLVLVPFVASYFLAFKKFDLRSARAFNRRQLLFFVPLLLLALAASLGVSYLVHKSSMFGDSDFYLTESGQLLKASWPGKLIVLDENGRKQIDTKKAVFWNRVLLEKEQQLFLLGYDTEDGYDTIIRMDMKDLSWKTLHQVPHRYLAGSSFFSFSYNGTGFVYLQRSRAEADRPGMDSRLPLKNDVLELVIVDPLSGQSRTITYRSPLFKKYREPQIFACDQINGRRFWLIGGKNQNVIRLWEDSEVEDLGISKKMPAYFGHLLFSHTDKSLAIRRLLARGSETIKEIAGEFHALGGFKTSLATGEVTEIYAKSGKQIVRIDLKTFGITTIGPENGYLLFVSPGDFYYVESKFQPYVKSDNWRKVYLLKEGKMIFLKQFDSRGSGLGYVEVEEHGIIFHDQDAPRIFAFPDLRELKFKKLN